MQDETVNEILKRAKKDPEFKEELEKNPLKILEEEAKGAPLDTDRFIYRIVVIALGITIILCAAFAFSIANDSIYQDPANRMETPQIFIALGSAAIGALAGLLSPSPRQK